MSDTLIDRITRLYETGNLEGAIKEFANYYNSNNGKTDQEIVSSLLDLCTQWLKVNSTKEIYDLRGMIYSYSGKNEEAIADYTKAINLYPNYAKAYNSRGIIYTRLQEYNKAIADYTKAIDLNPNDVKVYCNRGNTYTELQEYDKAIIDYTKATDLDLNNVDAYYNRGNAYAKLKKYDKAIIDYSKTIDLEPNYIAAYNNRGNVYFDLKEYDKVIADCTRAISLDPNDTELYNNRGNTYLELKEYEKSIGDYTKVIDLNPNDVAAYYNRGNAYSELKEYEKSIIDYTKAIGLDPNNAKFYNNRGNAYSELKEYEKSITDYSQTISLNPNSFTAYYNRGNAYFDLKRYEESITDYTQAIELNPRDVDIYYNRGIVYSELKKYERSIADYTQAIDLDPNYTKAYNSRGVIYFELKEYEKSIIDYTQAIDLALNAYSYIARGIVYARLKEYNKAIDDYAQAIILDPELKEIIQSLSIDAEKEHYSPSIPKLKKIIREIKETLLYKEDKITHYTGLNTTKILIEEDAIFRFSEGSFLNDTSEGQQLNEYLKLNHVTCEKSLSSFVRKPFIGSFVQGDNSNDLTLWRMYGKENNQDATGCALVLDKEIFLSEIKSEITSQIQKGVEEKKNFSVENLNKNMENIAFYHVCYFKANGGTNCFSTHCLEREKIDDLNVYLRKLKKCVSTIQKEIDKESKSDKEKAERLNLALQEYIGGIEYLFKGSEYAYEREVRMVLSGIGVERKFWANDNHTIKVYVELAPIKNALKQITIGPKVPKAEEWAAYFHYKLNPIIEKEDRVKVSISKLPYK